MKRKLDILIPQYNEDDKIIKPILDSLLVQQNVDFDDFGVIICNDGSDIKLSDSLLNSYPFKIEYYQEEHCGVSATRNACLDHSHADYVMFCDADDMFCNVCGLFIIFREIENGGFQALISNFTEETRNPETKEIIYINHEQLDGTFVHGKVYNRKYLIDNRIRFNPELTIHEDSYFNTLARVFANPEKAKWCPVPFYLWKWRDDSVCRHDPKYILKTYNNMLESSTALVNEIKRRGKSDISQEIATQMIFDAYYTMNKKEWIDQENQEYRRNTEKRFKKYWDDFKDFFNSIDEQKKNAIIVGQRNRFFQEGMMLETITFNDWIKHIEEEYK